MAKASITSTACTVCRHGERSAIENTLAFGASYRAVADRFDLSHDAVGRHWNNHVSEAWKAAARMGPFASREEMEKLCLEQGISVVEGLKALYAGSHAILVANREAGSTQGYVTIMREMRKTLESIGRITGEILPSVSTVTVNNQINNVTFLESFAQDLVTALADMPEALERIGGVLKTRMAAALPSPQAIERHAHAG